jgi:hypothetical protein
VKETKIQPLRRKRDTSNGKILEGFLEEVVVAVGSEAGGGRGTFVFHQ